ncbi:hypothetical protein CXP34_02420 [Ralstonia mannitolilytica]|nr:hypothetical protein CXP34_02420 [Ralstonia mannitolilytica]
MTDEDDSMYGFDVELSERETYFIGKIVALWGALEHEVFVQTLNTFHAEAVEVTELPHEMNNLQFTNVLKLWKVRVVDVADDPRREVLQRQYARICHYHGFRQAIVHGMWDWKASDLGRISSVRVRRRELVTVHFTADDLEAFCLDMHKINFRIRYPAGAEDCAKAMMEEGASISRRWAALLTDHPVRDELLPPELRTGGTGRPVD